MKHGVNDTTGVFDTIELNENHKDASKHSLSDAFISHARSGLSKMRITFSKNCDSSIISSLLDRVYYGLLGCSMKVIATFLLSFSVISLCLGYFDSISFMMFLFNTNTVCTLALIILSLLFFTTKKSLGEIISSSRIASPLSIVYDQQSVFCVDGSPERKSEGYSTAFFVGVLTGILSILFPAPAIITFLLSAVYCVFILGRPECGLLFSIFAIPFFNEITVIFLSLFTFIALIYKYLRGKRHIDFGLAQVIMLISMLYIILRGVYTNKVFVDYQQLFNFISFFLVCITAISLTRTTAILKRSIKIIMNISRIYAAILICYLVLCVIFSTRTTHNYLSNFALSGLMTSLTTERFIIPFLSIVFPLNFSLLISSVKSPERIKNIVFLIVLLVLCAYYGSYQFILTVLVFSLANIIFVKPKLLFLIIPCPAIAYGLVKLQELTPASFRISPTSTPNCNVEGILELFKKSPVFGVGIGTSAYDVMLPSSGNSVNSSALNLLAHTGFLGIVLLVALIFYMLYKAVKNIYRSSIKIESARTIAIGLVCSSMSLITCCFYCDGLSDYRIVYLFAIVLSLSYCAGRCYDADYIDSTSVREYHQF